MYSRFFSAPIWMKALLCHSPTWLTSSFRSPWPWRLQTSRTPLLTSSSDHESVSPWLALAFFHSPLLLGASEPVSVSREQSLLHQTSALTYLPGPSLTILSGAFPDSPGVSQSCDENPRWHSARPVLCPCLLCNCLTFVFLPAPELLQGWASSSQFATVSLVPSRTLGSIYERREGGDSFRNFLQEIRWEIKGLEWSKLQWEWRGRTA